MDRYGEPLALWLREPGHVLVVGYGKSGAAAARLLAGRGFRVTVTDRGDKPETDEGIKALAGHGVQFVFGGHPPELLHRPWQFVVKSPGIPYTVPFIEQLAAKGVPIFSEIEVASWFTERPIYAITGSNGKTTTTTLVSEMLRAAGRLPFVGGNIGTPFAEAVLEEQTDEPVVLEVSSFQLMGTWRFRPRGAALLNFYPAHLDYHGTFEAYQEAKWKMFSNMEQGDIAVLNADQDLVAGGASRLRADVHYFSVDHVRFAFGVGVEDEDIVIVERGEVRRLLPIAEVALPGRHNLQNVVAAAALAQAAGASDEAIRQVAATFQGVEHRLEFVRELHGVRYYNDSKATNPDAARQALRSFAHGIVWIAGGLDRGLSFDSLLPELRGRVKAAVCLGQTREALRNTCQRAGVEQIELASSLDEAVQRAHRLAEPGDTVLLSPACASWDMFSSFEVRGSMFKEAVHRL
ncbi:UDP-N-acetylmuramoylalanine--D-glutamate ligase [Alicyclobacillus hesperidum]|uniref:UDP-N-acetylmuramoylalanine--D-glutamate ligase n=1 Tax=Alicyclobacillus hesperidum TaxID=89784 RepID=A0AA37TZ43_9BACL|nr:UDP-N-acetylmuramoyl-L-alanine--D-glutamate ligase [Alicyclobacillus hesperidum]GLV13682.1 UDP-N-acetylmuramoylalanine--D-glutamate ligase [Alicyclobacillus hesperidum]